MNFNVLLPFCSSLLSFLFFALLVDQWRERRRSYQAVWAIGMLWYGLSAGTEFLGGAFGWSEPLYRAWYLIGAIWVAGWLGLGTVLLLGKTRFGYAFAVSLFLAGLFTALTQAKYDYADSGVAPILYFAIAAVLAVAIVVDTYRGGSAWPLLAAAALVVGTVVSAVMMAIVSLPAPGWVVDPVTHIPTGDLFPGYLRLLTPFFNITGAFALVLGGVYSTYIFMPKGRLIRYSLVRNQSAARYLGNLLVAPVAIVAEPGRLDPGRARRAAHRPSPQPRPGHAAHRPRRPHPSHHQRPEQVRQHERLLRRRVAGRRLPLRRVPGLDRGLQRDPSPVHGHRAAVARP